MSTPLVILGPTASGKSDVAMAFALRHGAAEVLAVDSMQVYRRMNIGTAKPSAADRGAVAHHGIDLAEPSTDFAVTHFERAAREAMAQISRRGALPVLVAGTGLYLRSLTDPMEVPGRWPELRAALEERAAREGSPALHTELVALDPIAAARMEPTNLRRVTRALEVTLGSGRPFSSFGPGLDQYPPVPFVQVGLQWPRPVLAERIAARVHRMMSQGLLAEVESLLAESPPMSRTARQALGYKELIAHLEGTWSFDEAVAAIIVRTRQFAVRQERWFRRDPRIRWVHIEHDPVAEVVPLLFPS
ncbi:MAG: tRNA (adenosine(37)-N6)-dimethylallyltransferase MiaA [Ilumatobacteraceae bacterium]|nr:tRNA (adenosine(37)-N6)-dimethylallyltransferase MiaA [Ilumatobacteraceae bacterium]